MSRTSWSIAWPFSKKRKGFRVGSGQWENNLLPGLSTMQKWDIATVPIQKQFMSLFIFLWGYVINPKIILFSDINLNLKVKSKLQFYLPSRVMRTGENVLQLEEISLVVHSQLLSDQLKPMPLHKALTLTAGYWLSTPWGQGERKENIEKHFWQTRR